MKTLIIALTCSLTAAACGSSSTRPAHDATSDTQATAKSLVAILDRRVVSDHGPAGFLLTGGFST